MEKHFLFFSSFLHRYIFFTFAHKQNPFLFCIQLKCPKSILADPYFIYY